MIYPITSKDNKKLKLLSAIATPKGRKKHGLFPVEGRRMVEEAAEFARDKIRCVFASEAFAAGDPLPESLSKRGFDVYVVSDKLFRAAANTVTPQGIAAAVEVFPDETAPTNGMSNVLALDGVSEPGNVGAIIRTAEAAGADAVYLMKGCADIYNPKSVRSTMGSIFRVKFRTGCGVLELKKLKDDGFTVAASALDGSVDLFEYAKERSCRKTAVVIGSEARGVSPEVLGLSDVNVRIPMKGGVESLNAAVAAGILMYALFE